MGEIVLARWHYKTTEDTTVDIVPDGCRDFIVSYDSKTGVSCFVSALDDTVRTVAIEGGSELFGVRLIPGASLDEAALLAYAKDQNPEALLSGEINLFCRVVPSVQETLDYLQSEITNIGSAARQLGVSERTLQRDVLRHTGKSPYFWFSLARARRCARSLFKADNLADTAAEHGFSDQAHMSREMRRWFGVTPSRFRSDRVLFSELCQPGYG